MWSISVYLPEAALVEYKVLCACAGGCVRVRAYVRACVWVGGCGGGGVGVCVDVS